MKHIILFASLLLSASMAGQHDVIDKYFSSYADDDSFTKVTVSSKMFELFTHLEGDTGDEEEILEAISKLKGMRMIAKVQHENYKSLYKSSIQKLGNEYEVLMTVEDVEDNLTFFIEESAGVINELVMIGMGEGHEFIVLSLVGNIDLKQMHRLSKSLQIEGMQHLDKIDEK